MKVGKWSHLGEIIRERGWAEACCWVGRGVLLATWQRMHTYERWAGHYDKLDDNDCRQIAAEIARSEWTTLVSVVMPVYNSPEIWLRAAIESVLHQLYPHWELCIANDASSQSHVRGVLDDYAARDPRVRVVHREQNGHIAAASNSALGLATGKYVALMDHDDLLPPHALYLVAREISRHPDVDILYTDEDKIDTRGRRYAPQMKPEWNQRLLFSTNYVSHLGVYRRSLVERMGGFRLGYEGSQDYDLALRCAGATTPDRIRHISQIAYHWRAIEGSVALDTGAKRYAYDAAKRALGDRLQAIGVDATVVESHVPGQYRVQRSWAEKPLVTVVVSSSGDLATTEACLESLRQVARDCHVKVLVVASMHSKNEATLRRKVAFDWEWFASEARSSAGRLNEAIETAVKTPWMCLLSDQVSASGDGWLWELINEASMGHVGMVGAKLCSRDGRMVHCGYVFDRGALGNHVGRGSNGAYFATDVTRAFSAVSVHAAAIEREKFLALGGFTAEDYPEHFYGLDLCMRHRERSLDVIWNAQAKLLHRNPTRLESQLVQRREGLVEWQRFKRRWSEMMHEDAHFSPQLSLRGDGFVLAFPPRVSKPWRCESG